MDTAVDLLIPSALLLLQIAYIAGCLRVVPGPRRFFVFLPPALLLLQELFAPYYGYVLWIVAVTLLSPLWLLFFFWRYSPLWVRLLSEILAGCGLLGLLGLVLTEIRPGY